MLSRSDSWGRSMDDFQRLFSGSMGAVLERPVWERVFGVTSGRSAADEGSPWLGCGRAFDLTDAGGEVFPWAFGWGDMGSTTLVRPSLEGSWRSVAERLADIAGRAVETLARMRSTARRKHSGRPTGAG